MTLNVGSLGYGGVPYGFVPGGSLSLRARQAADWIGYGQQPYGWGGYGGSVIPLSSSSGSSSILVLWRRRGRR